MTTEQYFEKFELFADAPDAVARMRELLLELAATGRLIPDALERSVGQDIRLMGEIVELIMGQAPPGDECNTAGRGTVFVKVGEFGPLYPEKAVWTTNPLKFAKTGDVLVCVVGATVGKLNLAIDCAIGRSVAAIRPSPTLLTKFLYYSLIPYTLRLRRNSRGSAQGVIGKTELNAVSLWVPSMAVQKRIVAKVDELMELCDRLEAQQKERTEKHADLARASLARFAEAPTPANLRFLFHDAYSIAPADLRKSILTLAVQGKLVPQNPDDGDSRAVVDAAMERRQRTIQSKSLRRKEFDESVELISREDLPSSWCVERIANLVDPENTISYGVLVPGNDVPDGIPFVRGQDLCLSNHPTRPNKTIAPEIEKPYARTRLTGGEILLCVVGSIGKLGTVPDSWAGANIARAVARIKPIPEVLRDYLLLVLQEDSVQTYFTSTTRTLAQPTLNVGMIEQTAIPVAPLAEQRRIVAKVDELMALVDQLESQLTAAHATGEKLMEATVVELTAKE
jgi:type I restriction enzyme S subunit